MLATAPALEIKLKNTIPFLKQTPPCLTFSGKAAREAQIESVFYYSLKLGTAFRLSQLLYSSQQDYMLLTFTISY
jgi:hypothetical protein